jgi:hypothetical protein
MTFNGSIHSRQVIISKEDFPTKLYTFSAAIYGGIFQDSAEIREYLLNTLDSHPEIKKQPHVFAIAGAWGYTESDKPKVRAIDIFSYRFDKPWKDCNPVTDSWVFKNGIHDVNDREVTCETMSIILGKEAQLRRETDNLEQFLASWPDIPEFGPVDTYGLPFKARKLI